MASRFMTFSGVHQVAVVESLEGRRSEQAEDLEMLILGKRLRDIADLPLDLAI